MRKLLILLGLIFSASNITSQQLYTDNGVTTFDGSKESFEPISAVNDKSVSVIDVNTGNIAALIYIKDFEFRLGLMQEHFNENYMDSGKYPKSTFSGVILNFDDKKLENKYTNFRIKGEIEIKGVKKEISTIAKIKKINNRINLSTTFNIQLSDYNVKIPRLVFKKIDENIEVNLNYNYEKK